MLFLCRKKATEMYGAKYYAKLEENLLVDETEEEKVSIELKLKQEGLQA